MCSTPCHSRISRVPTIGRSPLRTGSLPLTRRSSSSISSLQLRLGTRREPAVGQFLDAVGEALDQERLVVGRRLAVVEVAPELFQLGGRFLRRAPRVALTHCYSWPFSWFSFPAMNALVGGEVQGKVSAVAALALLRAKPQTGRRRGSRRSRCSRSAARHQVGVEGVGQGRDVVGEVRADVTSAGVSGAEDKRVRRIIAMMSDY